MTKFIEVHKNGERRLINLSHVELIECNTDGICVIYFAFSVPDAKYQDYIIPDETYEQIKSKIFRRRITMDKQYIEGEAADVAPVRHGRWVHHIAGGKQISACWCSVCNVEHETEQNYCPNCGAKMDGGVEAR